ncbi:MAG: hypothetical protein ACHREM_03715 [Polyangiales bacterium]
MRRLAVLLPLLSCACATTSLTEPVGAGRTRAQASMGGPIVVLGGAPLPIPVTSVGLAHGLSDAVDLHGDVHPTAAAFGVAGLDLGVAWHPLESRSLLTIGLVGYGFSNGADAVILADPWIGTRARVASWLALGGGVHAAFRVATSSSSLAQSHSFAPTLFGQVAFLLGHVAIEVEPRWYAFTTCGECAAPQYVSPFREGALGVVFGLTFPLDGDKR